MCVFLKISAAANHRGGIQFLSDELSEVSKNRQLTMSSFSVLTLLPSAKSAEKISAEF